MSARRPVRFFTFDISPEATLWLDDDEGEESSVVSVSSFDAMGHGRSCDRRLRVIVMQAGLVESTHPTPGDSGGQAT